MEPEQYMYFLMMLMYLIFSLCLKLFTIQVTGSKINLAYCKTSPPGGSFISSPFEGGLNREGLNRDVGLIQLRSDNGISSP